MRTNDKIMEFFVHDFDRARLAMLTYCKKKILNRARDSGMC